MARKKRADGEGSIYRAGDGWMASISLGSRTVLEDGETRQQRMRRSKRFKLRREAAKWLAGQQTERDRGTLVIDESQTVGEFLDRWLEETVARKVRPRTYESYESHVRVHIKPDLGSIKLAKLSAQQVQRFLNAKYESGLVGSGYSDRPIPETMAG